MICGCLLFSLVSGVIWIIYQLMMINLIEIWLSVVIDELS